MTDAHARLAEAEARALSARARLDETVAEAKARLAPDRLTAQGRDQLRAVAVRAGDGAVRHVRARPALYAAAGGVLALLLLRRPLAALFRRRAIPPPAPPYPGDRPPSSTQSKRTLS